MSTYKAVILKGKNHIKNDGSTNVKIRITHNNRVSYISTDLYVESGSFNNSAGVAKSGQNKDYINLRITDTIQKFQRKDIELGERRALMTVKQVKLHLLDDKENSQFIDFFDFSEEYLKTVISDGTLRWHESAIAKLKSFTGQRLAFSEINLTFLQRFERYLRKEGVSSGINNYMRSIRSLFNKARDKYNDEDSGLIKIPHYPFRKYKIPKATTKSKNNYLDAEELQVFINYKPSSSGEEFAKDMFLLMFYLIGIEVKDLFYLKKVRNGRISYDRFKTGKEFSIKLEPEALEIIKKYPSKKNLINVIERYSSHLVFMSFVNNQLHGSDSRRVKGIFPKLGIDKSVTTKWARHTWATLARNECRVNKDDVALCLGHQDFDNRVTDMYIKYDYSIIDESNRKVIDFVNLHCTSLDVPLDNK